MSNKLKIMVGINTLTSIGNSAYANHVNVFFRLGRSYPNIDFGLHTPNRMSIDRMRNETARIAVENNFDYVLFIDDDVLVPIVDGVQKLIDANADIAAGWTVIRGYPFENMVFKWNEEKTGLHKVKDEEITLDRSEPFPCDAVGFSMCLIKVELLRKVSTPYFVTGPFNTEDIYFCVKARDFVPDCSIIVHPQVRTAHMLDREPVTPENKRIMKEMYEKLYPGIEEKPETITNRGDDYVEELGIMVDAIEAADA